MKIVKRIKRKRKRRRRRKKVVFFDRLTILLSLVLVGLVLSIGGMLIWKEKNIKTDFQFFNVLKIAKENDQINKGDRVLISFSGPVQAESFSGKFVIEPELDFSYKWINNHQVKLIIEENPFPETYYEIKIKNFKSKWGLSNGEKRQRFSTNLPPQLSGVYPTQNQTGVKNDEKIIFRFMEPLADQYYLKVKSDPSFKFRTIESEDKNEIIIEPLEKFFFDMDYSLEAEIRSQNYPAFSKTVIGTNFKTEKPPIVVYSLDKSGNPIKFDYLNGFIDPKISKGRYIDIDLTNQNLHTFENGRELGAYKISSGIRGMNTPAGSFRVIARYTRPWSNKYELFMPWFIQFTYDGHGIHELPEWPGGYKEGANHLGIPVSHGCVRLGIGPAKVVYDFAEPGTPIIIHY